MEILQRLWYYPFGMAMSGLSQWSTEPAQWYRYNGKERDTLSGWYEYGYRWYDAAIGRFTGVDPIADQFAWASVFNYAENEPVGHIDLHGLQAALEIEMDRDIKAYVQGKMSRDEYCKRIQARGMGAIAGMGIGITVLGGGKLASIGAGWILRNPVVATEAAKTIGGVMWGLTTDQDMPGGGDDAGRALKYGPLREGLAGAKTIEQETTVLKSFISKAIHSGKQGKHIIGHNNYEEGKSILKSNAQSLLDDFHEGKIKSSRIINEVKTSVDFGKIIGDYVDPVTRKATPTTVGTIINSKTGAHIVPARPN